MIQEVEFTDNEGVFMGIDPQGQFVWPGEIEFTEIEKSSEFLPQGRILTLKGFKSGFVEKILFDFLKTQSKDDPNFNYISYYRRGRYKINNQVPPGRLFLGMKVDKELKEVITQSSWMTRRQGMSDPTCITIYRREERNVKTVTYEKKVFTLYAVVLTIPQLIRGTAPSPLVGISNLAFDHIGTLLESPWQKINEQNKKETRNHRCISNAPDGGPCP